MAFFDVPAMDEPQQAGRISTTFDFEPALLVTFLQQHVGAQIQARCTHLMQEARMQGAKSMDSAGGGGGGEDEDGGEGGAGDGADDGQHGGQIVEAVILVRLIKSDLKVARDHYAPILSRAGYTTFYVDACNQLTDFVAAVAKKVVRDTEDKVGVDPPRHEGTTIFAFELYFITQALVEEAVAGRDGLSPEMAISEFYVWFQPLIKQWMYLARSNGETWIKRAVEHDGISHTVTDDVMYSASVIDLYTMVSQATDFYGKLKASSWPNDTALEYNGMMIDMISHMVRLYAREIGDKLVDNDFFDTEGQFDVSQQVCTTLNNIQSAMSKLDESLTTFGVHDIEARHRQLYAEGAVQFEESMLTELIKDCRGKLQGHITHYSSHLVDNVGNEIRRLIGTAAATATELDLWSEELATPVLDYLESNLQVVADHTFDEVTQQLFRLLW